jgi:hypothetical protein
MAQQIPGKQHYQQLLMGKATPPQGKNKKKLQKE